MSIWNHRSARRSTLIHAIFHQDGVDVLVLMESESVITQVPRDSHAKEIRAVPEVLHLEPCVDKVLEPLSVLTHDA